MIILNSKRIKVYALILIFLIVTLILPQSKNVSAADFSVSGIGDIVHMWLHTNGNVRAMDNKGKVAEFNYVSWNTINNGTGQVNTVLYYSWDNTNKKVLFTYGNGWDTNVINSYIYDVNTNLWSKCTRAYNYIYKGNYYLISSTQLGSGRYTATISRYNYSNNLVDSKSYTDEGRAPWRFYGIDPINGTTVLLADEPGYIGNETHLIIDSNLTKIYAIGTSADHNGQVPVYNNFMYQMTNIGGSASYIFTRYAVNGFGYTQIIYFNKGGLSYSLGMSDLGAVASGELAAGMSVYLNNLEVFKTSSFPTYYYTTVCYDKFGNRIFGGTQGRVLVLAASGKTSTDSNFYTDYLINFSSEEARLAKESSLRVENKLDSMQTRVDNINNKAINIENKLNDNSYGLVAIKNEVNNLKNGLLSSKTIPIVKSIKGINGSTATNAEYMVVEAIVDNCTHYRINGSNWIIYNESLINIGSISKGINRVEMEFGNLEYKNGSYEGLYTKEVLLVFGV